MTTSTDPVKPQPLTTKTRCENAPTVPPVRLALNESSIPPPAAVLDAFLRTGQTPHRYPEPFSETLVAAIASQLGVAADHVFVGAGSIGILQDLIRLLAAGGEVVYPWRSFEAYPLLADNAPATSIALPLRPDGRCDLAALAGSCNDATRMIILSNPNNPTGTIVEKDEIEWLLERVPATVTIVLDEAYRDFADPDRIQDGLDLLRHQDNVVALRTFSKSYALAGLRVAFSVSTPALAEKLRSTSFPYRVNAPAQAAALAALNEHEWLRRHCAVVRRERIRLTDGLRRQGWTVWPSQANFVWLDAGAYATRIGQTLASVGITVRIFPDEGVRITIAEGEINDRVLAAVASCAPGQLGSPDRMLQRKVEQ